MKNRKCGNQTGILTMCAQLIERTPICCAFQIDQKKRTDDCRKAHNPDKSAQSRLAINKLNKNMEIL